MHIFSPAIIQFLDNSNKIWWSLGLDCPDSAFENVIMQFFLFHFTDIYSFIVVVDMFALSGLQRQFCKNSTFVTRSIWRLMHGVYAAYNINFNNVSNFNNIRYLIFRCVDMKLNNHAWNCSFQTRMKFKYAYIQLFGGDWRYRIMTAPMRLGWAWNIFHTMQGNTTAA